MSTGRDATARPSPAPVRVTADPASGRYAIDNGVIGKAVRVGPDGGLRLERWGLAGEGNLAAPATRWGSEFYTKTGADLSFGPQAGRHALIGHEATEDTLVLRWRDGATGLEIASHTRAIPGLAVLEEWIEIHNAGGEPVPVERLDGLLLPLAVPAGVECALTWVQGAQDYGYRRGVGTNVQPFGPFRVRCEPLDPGGSRTLINSSTDCANPRQSTSASENVDWFSLQIGDGGVFGGLLYSGEWALSLARTEAEVLIHGGVHRFFHVLAPGERLISPVAVVGAYRGTVDDGVHALHHYLRDAVMPPPPDERYPWVCYNTWYQWNIGLDEERLREEATLAAELGMECFYVDAGWYEGSPAQGSFGLGLGTWSENRDKFPSGLAALADHVHGLGMKFGLWMEPERVDLTVVDRGPDPLRAHWLTGTQLCLGCPEAVEWIERRLRHVIGEYHVDWLKWDHNADPICHRDDHGHQAGDGNFSHIQGLYRVFRRLREAFPHLVIENCAGGGNRMDLGMLRYTDTAWVSDAITPSYRVRYHALGASYPFPAQQLNSWYIRTTGSLAAGGSADAQEAVDAGTPARMLDYLFRSRMIGALGFSDVLADWPPNVREAARKAIAEYKRMRPILVGGDVYHLLPQPALWTPPLAPPEQPEAIEYWHAGLGRGVILAFRARAREAEVALPVGGLVAERRYTIESANSGRAETRTGAEWQRTGVRAILPEQDSSDILWITAE